MISPAQLHVTTSKPARIEGHRRDIQGLRAVAVLLVIGNHAGLPGCEGGFVGVDVFFVISGYVITQLLLRETGKGVRQGLSDFYTRRIRRIVPAAAATLVVTLLTARIVLSSRMDPGLTSDARWAALSAANFRFMATGTTYFVPGLRPSLVTQFWSLAVEEQFYLVFPMAVFLIACTVEPARRIRALRRLLVGAILASAAWSAVATAGGSASAYYSPFTRFWELGVGCLLATTTIYPQCRTIRADWLMAAAGCILIALASLGFDSRTTYPGTWAWVPVTGTALLIWAGCRGPRTLPTRVLSTRPMAYVGDISYSLYLTHYLWLKLPEQLPRPLTGGGWSLIELAGTVATAIASYHLIENPIRRSRRMTRDRVATVLLFAVCVAAVWVMANGVTAE